MTGMNWKFRFELKAIDAEPFHVDGTRDQKGYMNQKGMTQNEKEEIAYNSICAPGKSSRMRVRQKSSLPNVFMTDAVWQKLAS